MYYKIPNPKQEMSNQIPNPNVKKINSFGF